MKNKNQIQHGDVLLQRIGTLPNGAKAFKCKDGRLVVAEGEATGHNHTIVSDKAMLYELKGDLFLEVDAREVTITHEEHKPLPIPEGIYRIGRVKEYDYFAEMERRVID